MSERSPSTPDSVPAGLRAKLAGRHGSDTLCLPVGQLRELLAEIDELREHKHSFQDIVIFTSEHIAAICAELDLSYEAETDVVIAAIRRLRDGE